MYFHITHIHHINITSILLKFTFSLQKLLIENKFEASSSKFLDCFLEKHFKSAISSVMNKAFLVPCKKRKQALNS